MKNRAVIVSSGDIHNYEFYKCKIDDSDHVICVDGGYKHLKSMNIKPDVFFGDFDSCDFDECINDDLLSGVPINKFDAVDKNETDTQIAVSYALKSGFKDILMLGCIGNRMDHTIINILQLKKILQNSAFGSIINENNEIWLIDKEILVKKDEGYHLSLVALTNEVRGITTYGLAYPLENFTLFSENSRGISNEFENNIAKVTITDGLLLVIKSKD